MRLPQTGSRDVWTNLAATPVGAPEAQKYFHASQTSLMRVGFVAAVLLALTLPAAAAQSVDPQAIPGGIHLAYGTDPYSTMTVAWQGLPVPESRVDYGPTPEFGMSQAAT